LSESSVSRALSAEAELLFSENTVDKPEHTHCWHSAGMSAAMLGISPSVSVVGFGCGSCRASRPRGWKFAVATCARPRVAAARIVKDGIVRIQTLQLRVATIASQLNRWTGRKAARRERSRPSHSPSNLASSLFGPDLRMVSSCELAPVDWHGGVRPSRGGQLRSVKAQANSDAPNDIGSRCCSSVALL
jgi:hypothetical protein